jgi:hypothetical protein
VHGSSRALHLIFPSFRRVQMRLCLCDMLQAKTLRQPLPISAFVTLELSMSMASGLTGWNQRPQLLLLHRGSAV